VDGLNTPLVDLRWRWNCRSRLVDFVTARRLRPSADRDVLIDWPARWRGAVALCLRSQDLGGRDREFLTMIAGYAQRPSVAQLAWSRRDRRSRCRRRLGSRTAFCNARCPDFRDHHLASDLIGDLSGNLEVACRAIRYNVIIATVATTVTASGHAIPAIVGVCPGCTW
jgi:hypothetical protein